MLLKTAGEPLWAATVGMTAAALVLVPSAFVAWLVVGRPAVPWEAAGLGAVSGVLEAAYFGFLSAAYQRGDLSLVYPIARGSGTLLAVAAGIVVLGERPGPLGLVGIGALLLGFLWLQQPWRYLQRGLSAADPAVPFALATGAMIAAYSAVDRVGTRLVAPWLYAAFMWVICAAILVAWGRWSGSGVVAAPRRVGRAVVGGLLTLAAYLAILFAFSLAPLTAVAPLRESAIVLASGWGTLRLREAVNGRQALSRIGAAGAIVLGAVLLGLER